MFTTHSREFVKRYVMAALCLSWCASHAADGFHVRYSLYGGTGTGIFAQPDKPGWTGGVSYSYSDISALSGPDGKTMTTSTAAGSLPGGAVTYPANPVNVYATGFSAVATVGVSYGLESTYEGGRLVLGLNTGYGKKSQQIRATATTPALSPAQGALVTAGFNVQYQSGISALAAAETAGDEGQSDSDLNIVWHRPWESGRISYGLSLIVPTGKYSTTSGPHIGFGRYYTLRPSVQAVWFSSPSWGHTAKMTLGLNTINKDNNIRSGHWAALEAATSYMTSLGPVGAQVLRVQQFRDDTGGTWGANRFVMTNAGVFWATKLPVLDASFSLNAMTTLNSRNAKEGRFYQARVSKNF